MVEQIFNAITIVREMAGATRKRLGSFHPDKYYTGLSQRKKTQRRREIRRFGALGWKDPRAYAGFATDKGVVTRSSKYTEAWYKLFPEAKSLEAKAAATGVPLRFIQASFNRGMAAWRTGHRPGATQQSWAYARVHSLLLKGKTFYTADSDLAREAIATSASARKWFKSKQS
jgi:hypothetical protein